MNEKQTWDEEELKDLILFAQGVRLENEDLKAKIIAMDAYVRNGDAKIRQLTLTIQQLMSNTTRFN
jgi:hypothetical protein